MNNQKISDIIETSFPDYYKENGPVLIQFVKAYFEWLEQDNHLLDYVKNHLSNRDVDETIDQFLIHFKSKFVPSIQFQTESSTREMIKNALPFYRSRGTDLAFEMFFRSIFGVEAEIYYPYVEVFSTSSGIWKKDNYLEVVHKTTNKQYVGKQILGLRSQAKAFVDRVVTRIINGRILDVFYISAIEGNFEILENLFASGIDSQDYTSITGSLNEINVIDSGENFVKGEKVSISSASGKQAKGIVVDTETSTGFVNFSLVDGGWGYSNNVSVYISNVVLSVNVTDRPLSYSHANTVLLANTIQPFVDIYYQNATGTFNLGDIVSTYNNTNVVTGNGTVIGMTNVSANTGHLIVSPNYGDLSSNTIYYNQSNIISANLSTNGYFVNSYHGQLLNMPTNCVVVFSNASSSFTVGNKFTQTDASGRKISCGVISSLIPSGSNGAILLTNCNNLPYTGELFSSSNVTAKVSSINIEIGLKTNFNFNSRAGNHLSCEEFFSNGTISLISNGSSAAFSVNSQRLHQEVVTYCNTSINSWSNTILSNTSPIINLCSYANVTVGSLVSIYTVNPGIDYIKFPHVLIVDSAMPYFFKKDFVFNTGNVEAFTINEEIYQAISNTYGIVLKTNVASQQLYTRRLSFNDNWIANNFSNSSYNIVGQSSGGSTVLYSYDKNTSYSSIISGENAIVDVVGVSTNSGASVIKIIGSGFAFNRSINVDGDYQDIVDFQSEVDSNKTGTGFAVLGGQGISEGYWITNPEQSKRLLDSYYYHDYSYDVKTDVSPEKYITMLKKLLHISGKIYFTSIAKKDNMNLSSESTIEELTQTSNNIVTYTL